MNNIILDVNAGIYVVFRLEDRRFALPLNTVARVIRAVAITPLPDAPEFVLGVINITGRLTPVIDTRRRVSMPEKELELSSQFIISHTARRDVALLVDEVTGVIERRKTEIVSGDKVFPGIKYVRGMVKLEDDIILIYNLDMFLSLEEAEILEEVIALHDEDIDTCSP